MAQHAEMERISAALQVYAAARVAFLREVGAKESNRDPLSEFSERLVELWLGGRQAPSRVQEGWDVMLDDKRKVEVRSLANTGDRWVNEHLVRFTGKQELYALAVFEEFKLQAVVCFPSDGIEAVCQRLGKQHPNQDRQLQLTKANFEKLIDEQDEFECLGVSYLLPSSKSSSLEADGTSSRGDG